MSKHRRAIETRFKAGVALSVAALLSACAGGGGGGAPQVAITGTTGNSGSSGGSGIYATNSGGGGSVYNSAAFDAPAPATEGTTHDTDLVAVSSGNNFQSGPANGTALPLDQTIVTVGTDGSVTADTDTMDHGSTVTITDASTGAVHLSVPALGIDTDLTVNATDPTTLTDGRKVQIGAVSGNWSMAGGWSVLSADHAAASLSTFVAGFATPADALPTSGTAEFDGTTGGLAVVKGSGGTLTQANLAGDVTLNADFDAGTVDGSFTNMQATPSGGSASDWNDISISGSLATGSGTVTLSGDTAAASAPATPYALDSSATGYIDGSLFGPDLQELAAVWSLSDSDTVAVGVVGANNASSSSGGSGVNASNSGYGNVSVSGSGTVYGSSSSSSSSSGSSGSSGGSAGSGGTGVTTSGNSSAGIYSKTAGPGVINIISSADIRAPAAADLGTTHDPEQIAVTGGDNFQTGPANGTALPLIQSVLESDDGGVATDANVQDQGATITITDAPTGAVHLSVPGLALDTDLILNTNGPLVLSNGNSLELDTTQDTWTTLGRWAFLPANGTLHHSAFFVTGFETPASALPASGSAHFTGTVAGTAFTSVNATVTRATLAGDAAFNADFGAGTVDGTFTNITATDENGAASAWNDVSVNATLRSSAAGAATVTGDTTLGTTPDTPFSLDTGAQGHFNGGLFGPNGEELGGVWSAADGTRAAIGTVDAKQ